MVHIGYGPALGLLLASATSLMLWVGLVQVARWTAHALF